MIVEPRLLPTVPYATLDDYLAAGGGAGLDAARKVDAEVLIGELEASGLRGRGGAGFPTGTKWRTVAANRSDTVPTTVVVNAAEGEPGTFKDRTIMRTNPYAVIEGALIAVGAVGADRVIVAMKRPDVDNAADLERMRAALGEAIAAGWCDHGVVEIFEGPEEYLYGEETALLEVLNGRPPFPRIAPPFRHGADELVDADAAQGPARHSTGAGKSANVELAGPGAETPAPPALVDNVETLANVPSIVAKGAQWFRAVGTEESPGSIVCTVTGAVAHDGVGEIAMGTTVRKAIERIGGGVRRGERIVGVLGGASTALLPVEQLDTPLTYEAMAAAGAALGSASLIVISDGDDIAAVAAGFARFLAVESCGQCTPCKSDGLEISDRLGALCAGEGSQEDLDVIAHRLATVSDGARCNLALQTQTVVGSLLERHPEAFRVHLDADTAAVAPVVVAEIDEIADDRAVLADRAGTKQPDWTYGDTWSGTYPAALLGADQTPDDQALADAGPAADEQ